MTTPEERPGKLGIFSTENQDRKIGDRFVVEIPIERIGNFITWLYAQKYVLFDAPILLQPKFHDSQKSFLITFLPNISLEDCQENQNFLRVFTEWCQMNDLEMVNMKEALEEAKNLLTKINADPEALNSLW